MKINKTYFFALLGLLLLAGIFAYSFLGKTNLAQDSRWENVAVANASPSWENSGAQAAPSTQANFVKSTSVNSGGTPAVVTMPPLGQPVRPVSTVAGHAVEYPGQFAKASVQVDGKAYELTPNQLGNFPRILVQPDEEIHVQVAYPQGQAGDPVVVETEDGGNLDNKKTANVTALDSRQSVQFNFQTTSQDGIYHVALRNGPDVKVLSFWAGPEPEVRQ